MPQKYINKALGLHTFKNELTVPDGAMQVADNIVIDRDGIVESRRGFNFFSDFAADDDRAKQLLQYKDKLLLHYNNKLLFENAAGSFDEFSGDYNELESGLRIKGLENKGNFYFTSEEGVKKISAKNSTELTTATDYITDAGAVRAIDFTTKCNYATTGFFTANSIVAYRVVWGYKDNNNNLLLGYPSEIGVIRNVDANESCTVDLNIIIPSEIIDTNNTQSYFYQVYRSNIKEITEGVIADVEFKLVIEDFPTDADLVNGFIETNDLTPVDFRNSGADLYTNDISGEGEAQANTRPPLCTDITFFKGSVFYSNTKTRHIKTLSLISVDDIIHNSTKFFIGSEDGVQEYTFIGVKQVSTIDGSGFPNNAADIDDLDGRYFLISAANNIREYFVWYDRTGTTETPETNETLGRIPVRVDISAATTTDDIGNATAIAIDNIIDFVVTPDAVNPTIMTITNEENGEANQIADSSLVDHVINGSVIFDTPTLGQGEDVAAQEFLLSGDPSAGIKLETTAKSIVKVINSNSNEITNAFYISSVNDVPGQISFEAKTSEDKNFYLAINEAAASSGFNPSLPVSESTLSASLSGTTVTITWNSHGLSVGDNIVIFNPIGLTGGTINSVYPVATVSDSNTFTIEIEGLTGTLTSVDAFKTTESSDNTEKPNRVYFSKNDIPEAVPVFNYFDVGSQDSPISRIIPLRDSLFILKDEGVYRLSGTDAANFNVVLFDESSPIIAPDSPAVLNNQIFMLSTQGVVTVSDTGIDILSRNIEKDILFPTSNNFQNFDTQSFGIASESDRSYYLFLPTENTDTVATQCYRFNVFTRAWVRWDLAKTCGVVKKDDDKIYFGASDINYIEQERKNFQRTDYSDRQYDSAINGIFNNINIELISLDNINQFDALYQEQYITISRFNRLLNSLDSDPFLDDTDYFSTLGVTTGADLGSSLASLILKIDADDPETTYTAYNSSNVKEDLRDGFNLLASELNNSDGVFYARYVEYTSLIRYEGIISELSESSNQITLVTEVPFVIGVCITFQAIDCFVEYAPETLGDDSLGKHFREATLMFDQFNFTFGEMGFRSDVYASRAKQLFQGEGNGDYGTQVYGANVYGGLANERPFRTYVPRNHQRCRHLILSFRHQAARENFLLNGYSVTYKSETSEKFYRR